jgi:histone deacetylase complex regulatory component SIN3
MVGLKSRVKELFKGHNQLLVKFNAFLPNEAEVEDEDEVSSRRQPVVNSEYAMKYVLNVKV